MKDSTNGAGVVEMRRDRRQGEVYSRWVHYRNHYYYTAIPHLTDILHHCCMPITPFSVYSLNSGREFVSISCVPRASSVFERWPFKSTESDSRLASRAFFFALVHSSLSSRCLAFRFCPIYPLVSRSDTTPNAGAVPNPSIPSVQ